MKPKLTVTYEFLLKDSNALVREYDGLPDVAKGDADSDQMLSTKLRRLMDHQIGELFARCGVDFAGTEEIDSLEGDSGP